MKSLEEEIKQVKSFRNEYHKATVNLIFTGKWMINLHNDLFKNYGLSLQQYNILRILKGQSPRAATIKLLQDRMLDKSSDASRLVEILRKKGLVNRQENPRDRRTVDVTITEEGIACLAEIAQENDMLDGFLSKLNVEEIRLLTFLLDKARG